MENEFIAGISIKLNKVFGDEKRIYTEDVAQGLKEPCFFILPLNLSQSNMLASRKFVQMPFDVHYFPEVPNNNSELFEMGWELTDALEFITLVSGDMLHGTDMHCEVVDGVLHFFVSYNIFTVPIATVSDDEMAEVAITSSVKG